jgi:hypothetical protein
MALIIGSTALKQLYPDNFREPADLDVIIWPCEASEYRIDFNPDVTHYTKINERIEITVGHPGSVWEKYLLAAWNTPHTTEYADASILYSLKLAHLIYPYKWKRHMDDFQLLRRIVTEDKYPKLTKLNRKEAKKNFARYSTPRLKDVSPDQFFGQSDKHVKPVYVHDEIHKLVAFNAVRLVPNPLNAVADNVPASLIEAVLVCILVPEVPL